MNKRPKSTSSQYPFTLNQLRYLVAIGRYENMRAAAAKLHVAQPTLSAALREMEREIGVELFTRTSQNRLRITQLGKSILAEAERLLKQADRFEDSMHGLSQTMFGDLTIGVFSPIAPFWAPDLLKEYMLRYPGVKITFVDGNQETLQPMVLDGDCDALIIYDFDLDPRIHTVPLTQIEPYVLTPNTPQYEVLPNEVFLSQLEGEPYILLDLPNTRDYYLRIFEWSGTVPEIAYRVDSYESVRSFVGAGLGYTVLHQGQQYFHTSMGEAVISHSMAGHPPLLPIVCAATKSGFASRQVQAFLRVARDIFGGSQDSKL